MSFTAKDVQTLREKTGCGMMDCKQALTEAGGDMDKAVDLLREKGLAAAAKKAGRIAAEGIVMAVVENQVGTLIEVNSETDFVGKNAEFQAFVEACAKTVCVENPADVEALGGKKLAGASMTVDEALKDKILTIGENLKIRRFTRYEGQMVSYIHAGGRIGVLVRFLVDDATACKDEFRAYAKDIAMQVAAANPIYLKKEDVPAEVLNKEREILKAQAIAEGKPENIAEKMVEGRVKKYYQEFCLLEQPFVKESKMSVAQYTAETSKAIGEIEMAGFVRYEVGEGLEKREDNFADEVANMVK